MTAARSSRIISALRRRFGISAPELAVRTRWSWQFKIGLALVILVLLYALFYGGFDAGRLFAGFNTGQINKERERLFTEITELRTENEQIKFNNIELANNAQIAVGARDELSKQLTELQQQNTQLKEEAAFFEKLLGSAADGKGSLAIQRLQVEREAASSYHFRALVVQGKAESLFKGKITLRANLLIDGKRVMLNLPEQQPDLAPMLGLDFKTYQRVEASFNVPNNAELKSLQIRVFTLGNNTPKAQQSLQL